MSPEIYTTPEPDSTYEDAALEPEHEQSYTSCESKLGYTALCASCPLVALLGGCPKEIRENTFSNSVINDEQPFDDYLRTSAVDPYELLPSPTIERDLELPISIPEAKPVDIVRVEARPDVSGQPSKEGTQPVSLRDQGSVAENAREQKELVEPSRSYLDLLFDDTVTVVLAPQFTRRQPPTQKVAINRDQIPTTEIQENKKDEREIQPISNSITEEIIKISDSPHITVEYISIDTPLVENEVIIKEEAAEPVVTLNLVDNISNEHIDMPKILPPIVKIEKTASTLHIDASSPAHPINPIAPRVALAAPEVPLVLTKPASPKRHTSPDIPVLEKNHLIYQASEIFEEETILQEIITEEPSENLELILDEMQLEHTPADPAPDINDFQSTLITNVFETLRVPAREIIMDEVTMQFSPASLPVGTPEVLGNIVKSSTIQQPWSFSTLFGSIALLILVSIKPSS